MTSVDDVVEPTTQEEASSLLQRIVEISEGVIGFRKNMGELVQLLVYQNPRHHPSYVTPGRLRKSERAVAFVTRASKPHERHYRKIDSAAAHEKLYHNADRMNIVASKVSRYDENRDRKKKTKFEEIYAGVSVGRRNSSYVLRLSLPVPTQERTCFEVALAQFYGDMFTGFLKLNDIVVEEPDGRRKDLLSKRGGVFTLRVQLPRPEYSASDVRDLRGHLIDVINTSSSPMERVGVYLRAVETGAFRL